MASLSKILAGYKNDLHRIGRDSVLDLGNRVSEGTPIDKGRARQGWQHSGPFQIGRTHYYLNNVIYIRRLEYDGHSPQAPHGFLRRNVKKWPQIVRANI